MAKTKEIIFQYTCGKQQKNMLFHQFGARMNSHRRNSRRRRKDTAGEAGRSRKDTGRIQHLVRIGFSTGISRTYQKRTGLSCILFIKKASTKAIFPKTGQTAS